jgi:predicted ATPase
MTDCISNEFDLQTLATEYEKSVADTVTTSDFWKGNL